MDVDAPVNFSTSYPMLHLVKINEKMLPEKQNKTKLKPKIQTQAKPKPEVKQLSVCENHRSMYCYTLCNI